MTRFNPFTAMLCLMILAAVVLMTILQELCSYLLRLVKKIRKNYRYILYGDH